LPWQEEEHLRNPCQKEESQICPGRKGNTKGNPVRQRRVNFALTERGTSKKTLSVFPCRKRNTKEVLAG
jgi:hypothetical protein